MLLLLRLLRTNEQEVEDAENRGELDEEWREALAAATELQGEERGVQAGVNHTEGVVAEFE